MPNIDLSILNQRQTPAFYADVFANRPAAGFVGRIFVSTNTFAFYRDNGTSWDLIGGPGTGTITGSGAAGQVSYWNGASTITGSNDLFFDAVNGHLGIGTITPGTALDVKHDQSTVVQLEQITATNDIRIAFINSGVGLWRLGSFYNAGANDFGLFDIAAATQPVTVKRTTGQVLIGTSTVGSGKLVVASATGDNGVQIVGATAPSLRIDNAESGPTKRAGFGISTATNNFIQGSADRDFCMFNGSTTASPILFGIYNAGAGNVQEAARISSAYNLLVGTTTDNGRKLQINGDASFATNGLFGGSNNPGNAGAYTVSVGVPATTAGGIQLWAATNQSSFLQFGDGTASADNYRGYVQYNHATDSLILGTASSDRLTITSAGNIGIGVTPNAWSGFNAIQFGNNFSISPLGTTKNAYFNGSDYIYISSNYASLFQQVSNGSFSFNTAISGTTGNVISFTQAMTLAATGNLLIGTTTDAGQKLQVNGTALIENSSGETLILSKGTGPAIQFNKTSATAQGWQLAGDTAFRIINTTASTTPFQVLTTGQTDITTLQISNTVTAAVSISSTHKVSIVIGGVQYYLLASNV